MATKKIYIGSIGPILYDDTDNVDDVDGDFSGETQRAMTSDSSILITTVPTDPEEVVRLDDLGTIGLQYPIALDSMRSGLTRYPAPRTLSDPMDLFRYNFMMGN